MCCRTTIRPLDKLIAETVLTIGQFAKQSSGAWTRAIPEEHTSVTAVFREEELRLELSPSVSSMEQHHHKRLAAGVMYTIAAMYAEKVGGEVRQVAINVAGCKEHGDSRLLAQYPESRLDFTALCPGFQAEFTGGVEGDEIIAAG